MKPKTCPMCGDIKPKRNKTYCSDSCRLLSTFDNKIKETMHGNLTPKQQQQLNNAYQTISTKPQPPKGNA